MGIVSSESNERHLAHIVHDVLPEFSASFTAKALDYGGTFLFLGKEGQFSDMNRKFWKLKRSMWDGIPLTGESERTVLMDMVGHCLLAIAMIDMQQQDGLQQELPLYG